MACKALMIQGTASHAGKTVVVAALCRILSEAGYRVTPFKAQNMSLNSYVTPDGEELARAQAFQAFAAGIEPRAEMNPILLKPRGEMESQVVLMGKPYRDISAKSYYEEFASRDGIQAVEQSLETLLSEFDVIVLEGAGSPAEPNLYDHDIANMRVADYLGSPVFLVGDIDRGGVFASIVGTLSLLKPKHRDLMKGFIINKFRGDLTILEPGLRQLEELTKRPVLGVVPFVEGLLLPEEDSASLKSTARSKWNLDVVVIRLPHISNFTDFDPIRVAGAGVRFVESTKELGKPDAIIIPGTKNTVNDLVWLQRNGLANEIVRLRQEGVPVVGICGGYQILGKQVLDCRGIEGGAKGQYEALGLLDVVTAFEKYDKTTRQVQARIVGGGPILGRVSGRSIRGYEIHMGESTRGEDKPLLRLFDSNFRKKTRLDGAVSEDGIVFGCYVHGVFDGRWITEALLDYLAESKGSPGDKILGTLEDSWNESLNLLCRTLVKNVDVARIFRIAGIGLRAHEYSESTY